MSKPALQDSSLKGKDSIVGLIPILSIMAMTVSRSLWNALQHGDIGGVPEMPYQSAGIEQFFTT
jgi:hypothetical protein